MKEENKEEKKVNTFLDELLEKGLSANEIDEEIRKGIEIQLEIRLIKLGMTGHYQALRFWLENINPKKWGNATDNQTKKLDSLLEILDKGRNNYPKINDPELKNKITSTPEIFKNKI